MEKEIYDILSEIMDADPAEMSPETYLIRELGAESIDLLELAVTLNDRFSTEVNEDDIFLRTLRMHLDEAGEKGADPVACLRERYPFFTEERVREILADLGEGPVLKVKDLISYLSAER